MAYYNVKHKEFLLFQFFRWRVLRFCFLFIPMENLKPLYIVCVPILHRWTRFKQTWICTTWAKFHNSPIISDKYCLEDFKILLFAIPMKKVTSIVALSYTPTPTSDQFVNCERWPHCCRRLWPYRLVYWSLKHRTTEHLPIKSYFGRT